MYQHYVTEHAHPQIPNRIVTATTGVVGSLVALNTSTGKAASFNSETYFLNVAITGVAGQTGFYVTQGVDMIPGYNDMVSVCSCAVNLTNLPLDAVVMAFSTTTDLSLAPNIPLNATTTVWYPLEYSAMAFDSTAPGKTDVTLRTSWPVENDQNTARWFGVAFFGTYTAAARQMAGAISLRQVKTEYAVFQPNK